MGLSQLSYSPSVFSTERRAVSCPVLPVARLEAPCASKVKRARDSHPYCAKKRLFARAPLTGFSPALTTTASPTARGMSVSPPIPSGDFPFGRSRRLVFVSPHLQREKVKILLSTAPIERGEHVSAYHALRVSTSGGW